MAKSDRYVVPNSERGGWDVVKEGHRRATAYADTQEKAVSRARDLIRRDGGGELRIMNRSGKIVSSNTVKRSRAGSRPARTRTGT